MRDRILCPVHAENTPSMVIYDTHGVCFGCGARIPVEELALERIIQEPREQEDIDASLNYITSLPTAEIRGLRLHADEVNYYLVFPNTKYYLKRSWEESESKYKGPYGHRKPLFEPVPTTTDKVLFAVEGQINAATLSLCTNSISVVSPGGTGDFSKYDFMRYCLQYDSVCIIVDKDPAGVVAGLDFKSKLLKAGKRVVLYPMEEDINALYCKLGKEAVLKHVNEALRLL